MDLSRWLNLVGRPYGFPSEPPKTFDCWTLVKHVRASEGLPCPLPFDDREAWCNPDNLARATDLARPLWRVKAAPEDLDMAVLEPSHVGIVLRGGVLHALARNASVIWSTMAVVRRRWPNTQWWAA